MFMVLRKLSWIAGWTLKRQTSAKCKVFASVYVSHPLNKPPRLLPVNVDGMTVALHFYKRGTICGEKAVDVFETQLIVPGGNQDMYEIPFARTCLIFLWWCYLLKLCVECDAILQISLGGELSVREPQ
jgi:hypothetical protein